MSPSGTGPPRRPSHWPTKERRWRPHRRRPPRAWRPRSPWSPTPRRWSRWCSASTAWPPRWPQAQLLIDMSTVGPDAVRSVAARLPHGARMVDAPVRGSIPEATAGRLAIYVGADPVRLSAGPADAGAARHAASRRRAGSRRGHQGGRELDPRRSHRRLRRGAGSGRHPGAGPLGPAGRAGRLGDRQHCQGQARRRGVRPLPAQTSSSAWR